MPPDLSDDDKAVLIDARRDRRRPLPAVAADQELQGDPGEARPAGAATGAVAAAETAG
jgi:hypothetical protein